MEDNFKNKFGFIVFGLIVITLAIGGYFYTDYVLNKKDQKLDNEEIISYKIDEDKDYIYYKNESAISEELEINYKEVVINIADQEEVSRTLNNETQYYKNNIRHISTEDLVSVEMVTHNYDDLYAMIFRKYEDYEFNNLVSLLVQDYDYSCFDLINIKSVKSYIFDTKTGKLLGENEILDRFNINMEQVKEKIREFLNTKQSVIDDIPVIKIDETLNDFNNYAFYVNDLGKLCVSYLVKTTQVDYNEVTEVI